jgi:serine/threonine protein kinase
MAKCLVCYKHYKTKRNLKRHMRESHDPKQTCKYCFKKVIRITQHLKYCKIRKIQDSYNCNIFQNKKENSEKEKPNFALNPINKDLLDNSVFNYKFKEVHGTNYIYFPNFILGKGNWGKVFYGFNKKNKREVAVKIYSKNIEEIDIEYECGLVNDLDSISLAPKVYYYSSYQKIFIQSLLGPNLEELFNFCSRRFSIKTIANIGIELLDRIEAVHNLGFIHRDISPNNIVWLNFSDYNNISKDNLILIDFGIASSYLTKDNKHITFKEKNGIFGTQYYSSTFSSKGNTQSRRDDIEAIFNCLAYFFDGILPWDSTILNEKESKLKYNNSRIENNENNNKFKKEVKRILKIKESLTPTEFCNKMPSEFKIIYCYIKNLAFEEKPDYNNMKLLLFNLIKKEELENPQEKNFKYSWEKTINDLCKSNKFLNTQLKLIQNKLFYGHPINIKKLLELLNIKI